MKKSLLMGALLTPVMAFSCIFFVKNDSGYHDIYISANHNIAAVASQDVLENAPNVVRSSRGLSKTKTKGIPGMWFDIYTPMGNNGQFERTYSVEANNCSQIMGENNLSYTKIINDQLDKKRFKVVDLKKEHADNREKDLDANRVIEKDKPAQPEYLTYDHEYPEGILP